MKKQKMRSIFKKDLLEELGLTDHEKSDVLFDMAWDGCNDDDGGFREVTEDAYALSKLLK